MTTFLGREDVPRRARRLGWVVLGLWTVGSVAALGTVLLVRQAEVRGIYRLVREAFTQRTLQRMEAARGRLEAVLAAVPGTPAELTDLPEAAQAVFFHQVADIATFGSLLRVRVTDRQGTALFASEKADVGEQEPLVAGGSGPAPVTRFHAQEGEDVLCVAVPLTWGESHVGWLTAHRSTVELNHELASARDEIRRGLLRLLIVFGAVCIILGVTFWYLVRQLSRAEAEASERARLASMGELALAMAHEVRNPLNSISLICQYVLRLLAGEEEPAKVAAVVAEQVGLVRDEVDKLAGVVDNVMRFAWPAEPVPQAASVAGICRRAVELQQAELTKRRVEVALEIPEELEAWVDAEQVTRAFINLVRNAAEAMPQGGRVHLSAGGTGDWVAVSIRDGGPGIGARDGSLAPGLGRGRSGPDLGLPIAQAIIRAHGGEVQAEDHPDGGAVFTVLLPADEDAYERRTRAPGRG